MPSPKIICRPFKPSDSKNFLHLVEQLAKYEKLSPPARAARSRLLKDIGRRLNVMMIQSGGKSVGYAVWFFTYSSFLAKTTLYLEDFFVLPEYRRSGIGARAFKTLVRQARRSGCGRMEWMVLNWNRPGLNFYAKAGAKPLKGWTHFRLEF